MNDLWLKIELRLQQLAPRVRDVLGPPASDSDLEGLLVLDESDSPALSNSLRIHNGQKHGLLPVVEPWILLTAKQITDEHTRLTKSLLENADIDPNLGSERRGFVKADVWNKRWIPFATDGSGNYLCVDLDPDVGGTVGQVIQWAADPPYVEVTAASFRAWLETFEADLERGLYEWENASESWSRVED